MSRSAGTSTLSKKTRYCFSGAAISTAIGCISSPGVSTSTTKSESLARPDSSSTPVRATTSTHFASSMPEMNVLLPVSR